AKIDPGDSQTSFDINIIDDNNDENNETIIVTLSDPVNGGLGTNSVYIYTITDNDGPPTIQFSSITSSGDENESPAQIEVSVSPMSGKKNTVDYSVTGGTATGNGTDYSLIAGTLTIPADDSTGNINITIVDDGTVELDETIEIDLSDPSNATLGDDTIHTFSIQDNDYAQYTGPGGVGDNTTNLLWLRADDLSYSDNDPVSTWTDTSGNNYDATQAGTNRPFYKDNIVNGKPIVRFDGTEDYFDNIFAIPNQNMTIYIFRSRTCRDG
ncbi:unnamed protein product, partial [marine sediment metagenome]